MTTRRKLVIGGAGAALAAGLGPASAIPAARPAGAMRAKAGAAPVHRSLLGARFAVHGEGGRLLTATLEGVQQRAVDARIEQFTATFAAPATPALTSGIYRLSRRGLGRFELYLDVSPRGAGQVLQAEFGLLREAPHASAPLAPLLAELRRLV